MALSRRDRFQLKTKLVDELNGGHWSLNRINLLFGEFGLMTLDDDWNGPSVADVIAPLADPDLIEMYALVVGVDLDEVAAVVQSAPDEGSWRAGYVRVFLSHSALHREFVAEVADELDVIGIHGFVAHDILEVTKPWQAQIEQALRSMQAFVALIHPEFNLSPWCHQEAGWAFGRRVPHFAIRLQADPQGFLGSDQWPSAVGQTPAKVSQAIGNWVCTISELRDSVTEGLFRSLVNSGNYFMAEAAARQVVALETLSTEEFERLDQIWLSNDQLYGGVLPTKVMRPFYLRSGRSWPPKEPAPPRAPASVAPDSAGSERIEPF